MNNETFSYNTVEKGFNRSTVLKAHTTNNLESFSVKWWESLIRAYTYMYICSGKEYFGQMMRFCEKKKKLKNHYRT